MKRIWVKYLQDVERSDGTKRKKGEIHQIDEASFDEALHERTEAPETDAATSDGITVDDLRTVLAEVTAGNATAISQGIATALRDAGVGVIRDEPAVRQGSTREPIHVSPAWEVQYDALPADERKYRTPENDLMTQRFLIASATKDWQGLRECIDRDPGLTADQKRAALAEGAAATGGNLVPTPMASTIALLLQKTAAIGPRASTFTSPNQTIELPTETLVMVAAQTAEGATASENDPTWGQVTLTKKKSVAATRSSFELLADSPFAIVSVLSRQAANAFAINNDTQDCTAGDGAGANQTDDLEGSNGAGEATNIGIENAAVGVMVSADITALYYSLLGQYRNGAVWVCDNGVMEVLANLQDATSGRQLLTPLSAPLTAIEGGQGQTGGGASGVMMGRPVVEAPFTAQALLFGDLSYYNVLQDGAIRVEASTEAAFLADQTIFKFVQRRDGGVTSSIAFRKSTVITLAV